MRRTNTKLSEWPANSTTIYTYVHIIYIHIHTYVRTYIHAHIHTFIMHAYLHAYTHAYMYVCMNICMYTCVYVSMDGWMHTSMHSASTHTFCVPPTYLQPTSYTVRLLMSMPIYLSIYPSCEHCFTFIPSYNWCLFSLGCRYITFWIIRYFHWIYCLCVCIPKLAFLVMVYYGHTYNPR